MKPENGLLAPPQERDWRDRQIDALRAKLEASGRRRVELRRVLLQIRAIADQLCCYDASEDVDRIMRHCDQVLLGDHK